MLNLTYFIAIKALIKKLIKTFSQLPYGQYKFRLFLVVIGLHIIAAFFSEGYHKLDEHDGIVISTSYLIGDTAKEALSPGETKAMIRSWLQPAIYATVLMPLKSIGLSNPFSITFVMRFINMLFGLIALYKLSDIIPQITEKIDEKKTYLMVLFFFWLFPFLHVRTTSESLSGVFFILAFSHLVKTTGINILESATSLISKKSKDLPAKDFIYIGFLFSLSFTLRVQMAIMIFFTCLWVLLYTNLKIRNLAILTLSFFISLIPISCIDYLGYQQWTFPPYNNYIYNAVQGVASSLGTDPIWKYLEKSLLKLIPPYSILILLSLFWFWFKRTFSLISIVTISYFVIHSLIPHKELRFLFPITYFIPFALTYFVHIFNNNKVVSKLYSFSIFLNIILLLKVIFAPAYSAIGLYKVLYSQKITYINTFEALPRKIPFYSYQNKLVTKTIKSLNEADGQYIFTRTYSTSEKLLSNDKCSILYSNYPIWFVKYLNKKLLKKSKVLFLLKC